MFQNLQWRLPEATQGPFVHAYPIEDGLCVIYRSLRDQTTNGQDARLLLTPSSALSLARWILDTFGEAP